jgi:hypothetical protein
MVSCSQSKQREGEKENLLYRKNMYILQLLLNVVSAGTEAPVVSGNKFLLSCIKEVS